MLLINNNKLIVNGNRLGISKPKYNGPEILTYQSNPVREITGPCVLKFMIPSYFLAYIPNGIMVDNFSFYFLCDAQQVQSPLWSLINYDTQFPQLITNVSCSRIELGYHGELQELRLNEQPRLYELHIEFFGPGTLQLSLPQDIGVCMDTWLTPMLDCEYQITEDVTPLFLLKNELTKNKSCYIKYTGGDAELFYGQTTDFTPQEGDVFVGTKYNLLNDQPIQIISDFNSTNLKEFFRFAKLKTTSRGTLSFLSVLPPKDGVVLLEYNNTVSIDTNLQQTFCISKDFSDSIQFISSSDEFELYISNVSDFDISNESVLAKYQSLKGALQLTSVDIQQSSAEALDDYIYIKFNCKNPIDITPMIWTPSSCANQSILLCSGAEISVPKLSKDVLYRLRYDDWKGHDLNVSWNNRSRPVPVYVASVCDFTLSSDAPNVLCFQNCPRGTTVIAADVVNSWGVNVDEDGFLYVRMNPQAGGTAIFTSIRMEE